MGDMIDAMYPGNIPAAYNGLPAMRISCLANPEAHVFDVESGNATGVRVAPAARVRVSAGMWAGLYTNWDLFDAVTADLEAVGLRWSAAADWPAPGVYLWAADPSGNIAAGRWRLPVDPLAVQDRYPGPVDLSRTAANFPARVAGYLDGAISTWPAAAWSRFEIMADASPGPAGTVGPPGVQIPKPAPAPVPPVPPKPPAPPAPPIGDTPMIYRNKANGAAICIDGAYRFLVDDVADFDAITAAGVKCADVSAGQFALVGGDLVDVVETNPETPPPPAAPAAPAPA
jgi:hypothetical protein